MTRLPDISKRVPEKEILKCYRDLFYNAEYILKKDGKIVVAVRKTGQVVKIAEEYKFRVIEEREIWQGKDILKVAVLKRRMKE